MPLPAGYRTAGLSSGTRTAYPDSKPGTAVTSGISSTKAHSQARYSGLTKTHFRGGSELRNSSAASARSRGMPGSSRQGSRGRGSIGRRTANVNDSEERQSPHREDISLLDNSIMKISNQLKNLEDKLKEYEDQAAISSGRMRGEEVMLK